MKNMKQFITMLVLGLAVGCAGTPRQQSVPLKQGDVTLTRLKAELPKAHMTIKGREIDVVVEWVTHSYARNCQRPLDINLVENKLGAFVHPIQNLTPLNGPSLQDVAAEFGKQVKAYLKGNGMSEGGVQAGDGVQVESYLEGDAEQVAR